MMKTLALALLRYVMSLVSVAKTVCIPGKRYNLSPNINVIKMLTFILNENVSGPND